jgi:hypothetical protein
VRVLVDADGLVYAAGFASQVTDYDVAVLDCDGEMVDRIQVHTLDEVEAFRADVQSNLDDVAVDVKPIVAEQPIGVALGNTKRMLNKIRDRAREIGGQPIESFDLWLTGGVNYRDAYAKVRPYKGNRIDASRPVYYQEIREYLADRWEAQTTDGCEADDMVTIMSHTLEHDPARVMIVSADKDLATVPGLLYNWRSDTHELISRRQARTNFYRQMITGDATDNVMGVYKSGPTRAEKIIAPQMSRVEQARVVYAEFHASMSRAGCPYADRSAEDVMLETGILLHMQRTPGEIWKIPEGVL